ncbi:MAG: hypothetical protein KY394_08085, partial [Actinobacteria bacterium]|nr:hypothetical protein [Actinomycetota bacterium]
MLLIVAAGAAAVLQIGELVGPIGIVIGSITAGLVTLRRSRSLEPRERRAWQYLAGGMFLVGVGVLAVAFWQVAIGDPPAFGPSDIFFVSGYALLVATLVSLARSDADGANWTTTLLDALVGGVALAALVWTTFFHDLMIGFAGAPWWEAAIGFSYPVLDIVVVVGVMVLVMRRSHFHFDLRLVFLGLAMAVQVLA